MKSAAITGFWQLAKRDAAVQEMVVAAAKQAEPLQAIARLAEQAGFRFTAEDLQSALAAVELSDDELAAVSGGVGGSALASPVDVQIRRLMFSPAEWFAEG